MTDHEFDSDLPADFDPDSLDSGDIPASDLDYEVVTESDVEGEEPEDGDEDA